MVVTLGIYWILWRYWVFSEVDRQSGQRFHSALFWWGFALAFVPYISIIGGVLQLVYVHKEIRQLNEARRRAGLPPGIKGATFVLLALLPYAVLMLAAFTAGLIAGLTGTSGPTWLWVTGALLLFIGSFAAWGVAVAKVQASANAYWSRMRSPPPARRPAAAPVRLPTGGR